MQQTITNYFLIDEREHYTRSKKTNRSNKKKKDKNSKERTITSNAKTH